jgi:hypothetical protein
MESTFSTTCTDVTSKALHGFKTNTYTPELRMRWHALEISDTDVRSMFQICCFH